MIANSILSIDQGTTNTKVLVVDSSSHVVARASRPLAISYPQPGWVEQDPAQIWSTVCQAIEDCLQSIDVATIAAIAISNQRESVVVWDRATGAPIGPCIVWQCRRTAPFCASLRERGLEDVVRCRTGLGIDPLFSAGKIRWLLDHAPQGQQRAERGDLCAGTVDSWLLWNLTGGRTHACDATNASRTQLLNLSRVEWDPEMLRLFDIPRCMLPQVLRSSSMFASTSGEGILPEGIPIASMIGDSHAAMFSHAAFRPVVVKATYGTGSSLMLPTPGLCQPGPALSSTVAWAMDHSTQYGLEGNITMTGGAMEWLGSFLELDDPAQGAADRSASVADNGGVYLVPAFAGLGAPYWDDAARGLICGLTRGTTSAHVARATLESIAYQVRDVFDAMEAAAGVRPASLLADGGASRNDLLMQFQADILGCPVIRNASTELSAMGAAWLAGLTIGTWRDVSELQSIPRKEDVFNPRSSELERQRLYEGWQDAVSRTRSSGRLQMNENSRVHGSH